eukprot:Nk52_evm11s343 gene=Nk52_evmTU11s343
MPRHSKNSTAQAFFSYHERSILNYGTQTAKLTRDSCRDFDSCFMCLHVVVNPVVCQKGHLCCKECALKSLLKQKEDIERNQKLYKKFIKECEKDSALEKGKQLEKVKEKFEKEQSSVKSSSLSKREEEKETSKQIEKQDHPSTLDAPARKENAEKDLPSFWVPSLTPSIEKKDLKEPSKETLCTASNHPVKLKHLVNVTFTPSEVLKRKIAESKSEEENPSKKQKVSSSNPYPSKIVQKIDVNDRWVCPGCSKSLSNAPKLGVVKVCGHLLCEHCVKSFVLNESACFVCSKKMKHNGSDKDVIMLHHDGTGHAGHGESVEVKRYNYAFQC